MRRPQNQGRQLKGISTLHNSKPISNKYPVFNKISLQPRCNFHNVSELNYQIQQNNKTKSPDFVIKTSAFKQPIIDQKQSIVKKNDNKYSQLPSNVKQTEQLQKREQQQATKVDQYSKQLNQNQQYSNSTQQDTHQPRNKETKQFQNPNNEQQIKIVSSQFNKNTDKVEQQKVEQKIGIKEQQKAVVPSIQPQQLKNEIFIRNEMQQLQNPKKEKQITIIPQESTKEEQQSKREEKPIAIQQQQKTLVSAIQPSQLKNEVPILNKLSGTSSKINPETIKNKKIVLLLGTLGVGKKQLMRKLFNQSQILEFNPVNHPKLGYMIAVTPAFDFEQNIDQREAQIKQYQQFFIKHGKQLEQFFIVVNFERTDLMKNKVISIYKYFRKFKNLITIIVTQFQLSENRDSDKISLQKAFRFFSDREIIFINSNDSSEQIEKQFENCLNGLKAKPEFDFSNTIFELEDQKETQVMLDKLNTLTQQIAKTTGKYQ